MDKFGIFNLLNSLLNLNNSNNNFTTPQQEQEKGFVGEKQIESPNTTFSTQKNVLPAVNKSINGKPLQSYMLDTISSHDKIVERVNAKINKNKF